MLNHTSDGFTVVPFPKERQVYLDSFALAYRKHVVHGLMEVDVTAARQLLREHKARTGQALSFTAYVVACLGRAVAENKAVQGYRNWRNQLVLFDDVDVSTIIEIQVGERKTPLAHVVRAANRRSYREIHDEIRSVQAENRREKAMPYGRYLGLYGLVPAVLRRAAYRAAFRNPHLVKKLVGTVGLTSVGMFGQGGGWIITVPVYTLGVSLGGIAEKPVVVEGEIVVREFLGITLTLDHDVVDGGPAARFSRQFKELIENGVDLIQQDLTADGPLPGELG
jgi:pyruvate/2-oxoglutarate dehydrogenase complex dihydrolipoamide acyltransferase (E2) component